MYKGKKLSLVFPAYNEEKNIKNAIADFKNLAIVDEILVIDNKSTDNTHKIAKKSGAIVVTESNQGYGFALRRGLRTAKGDYVVLCEPDGTFDAKDIFRLLRHIENADMVQGSRTHKNYIKAGANLGFLLRTGNIVVAKLMQTLYHTNKLTDCGCTFRILKSTLIKKILPSLKVGESHFLPELVIITAINKGKIIEIPVNYKQRIGNSKITGSMTRAFFVCLQMLYIICSYKFRR